MTVNCGAALTVTKDGNSYIVTERDRPVAKIIPVEALPSEAFRTVIDNVGSDR